MSNLESLIPPLELCKQIPAGEFDDSAMASRSGTVRRNSGRTHETVNR